VVGWKRKVQRREREGRGYYRHAKTTKQLLEKVTWFREKRKRDGDEEEDEIPLPARKRIAGERKVVKKDAGRKEVAIKAVMFIPFPTGSRLAKKLREAEEKLGSMTGYRLKLVEKAGDKLENMLTKSNPWQGLDCRRQGCFCVRQN
jgi:hypothetical protein